MLLWVNIIEYYSNLNHPDLFDVLARKDLYSKALLHLILKRMGGVYPILAILI